MFNASTYIAFPDATDDRILARRTIRSSAVLTAKQSLTFSVIGTLFDADSDDASGAILENHGRVLIMYRIRGAAIVVRIYKPASAIMSPREHGVHQMQDEKSSVTDKVDKDLSSGIIYQFICYWASTQLRARYRTNGHRIGVECCYKVAA